jgi:serine/threonine-protein kinase
MSTATLPIAPGDVLAGKYRVDAVVGRGGMGVVVAATHLQLEQPVAIKLLVHGAGSEPEMRARFAREARAASKIRSEHVARVLDVGTLDSGVPYIVMEYLEGEDLSRTLRRRRKLPVDEAVDYVLQACEALAEAHVAGIVHRDLKPANVFLARRADGSVAVKLLDFGVSKIALPSGDAGITTGATILGSPTYMPPEQLRSARDVDARGDLWSIGATLFELVSGEPAFRADTLADLCVHILGSPAPELRDVEPSAPEALSAVVRRCLAKDPAERFADVAELANALGPFAPPRGQLSVERITRVVSGATPTDLPAPTSASASSVRALQDASTVKSLDAPPVLDAPPPSTSEGAATPGEMARSVASNAASATTARRARPASIAVGIAAAIVALAAAVVGTGLATRKGPVAPVASEPPPVVAPLPLPPSATTTPVPTAPIAPSSVASSAAAPLDAPTAAPPARAPHASRPAPRSKPKDPQAPLPSGLSGTEGFGDRK